MSAKPFKTYAPFGVATKRFAKVGFHPELDVSGAMKKDVYNVSPASYYPKTVGCKYKNGIEWKRELECEEFSKYLNFHNRDLLNAREFQKTLGGPAIGEINEDLFKQCRCSVLDDIGFGTGERFKTSKASSNIPPPNTYFRPMEKICTVKVKQFTNVPRFEWDGKRPRITTPVSKNLPPNRYRINHDRSIDAITRKLVSLRGPYDLFTGPRDQSTIKNHFSPSSTRSPEYYYIKPSTVDVLLRHPSKSRNGLFLQAKRFPKYPTTRNMLDDLSLCYRDPDYPGPAKYDLSEVKGIKEVKPSLHPFDTSQENARPPPNWTIFPGPGRYNPKAPKCQKIKRPSWVFLSKGERKYFTIISYKSF